MALADSPPQVSRLFPTDTPGKIITKLVVTRLTYRKLATIGTHATEFTLQLKGRHKP